MNTGQTEIGFTNQPDADTRIADTLANLANTLQNMRNNKPDERSELARIYAVAITQVEKAYAHFAVYAANVLVAETLETQE